ncbi:hypothetical protein BGX26_003144 [Mortierella sp. AD094]|nr:hypothetical protein BGX26_003144 [Mortierella sp. AD094]
MSASIVFDPIPTSDPADDKEPITTRPRRKLSYIDRIDLLFDAASSRMEPILVIFAVIVMLQIFFCFFAVFLPFHYSGQKLGEEEESNSNGYFLTIAWSCYLTWGVVANYYYCIATPPGSALDEISTENMLTAQTTLEKYDNSYMKKVCKKKGDKFSNMYDFGIIGNLLYFLNVGRRGPWYTALLPIRVPPIGNGKRFEKSGHGYVLDFDEDDDHY